jgi:uncharacterized membrane protein
MPWLALGYPALAHLGVWLHSLHLQWLALVWLLTLSLWGALAQRRTWAWAVLVSAAVVLYWLTMRGNGLYLLYIPPIVIPLAMLLLCARSLRSGETPFISRIAEAMRGEPLPDVLRSYTRYVTQLWCGVSAALVTSAIVTAIWASAEVWSLATNVIHYIILGAVFVIEFSYRRIKYAHLERWGFIEFLRRLVRTKVRV